MLKPKTFTKEKKEKKKSVNACYRQNKEWLTNNEFRNMQTSRSFDKNNIYFIKKQTLTK